MGLVEKEHSGCGDLEHVHIDAAHSKTREFMSFMIHMSSWMPVYSDEMCGTPVVRQASQMRQRCSVLHVKVQEPAFHTACVENYSLAHAFGQHVTNYSRHTLPRFRLKLDSV